MAWDLDARRARGARADRQDTARWASAAPGDRGLATLEQQLKLETERGAAPSESLAEAKQQLDEAMVVARSLNVELFCRAAACRTSRCPHLAGELEDRNKDKLSVRISADPRADLDAEGCPHGLRVGQRVALQRRQVRAATDCVTLMLGRWMPTISYAPPAALRWGSSRRSWTID